MSNIGDNLLALSYLNFLFLILLMQVTAAGDLTFFIEERKDCRGEAYQRVSQENHHGGKRISYRVQAKFGNRARHNDIIQKTVYWSLVALQIFLIIFTP